MAARSISVSFLIRTLRKDSYSQTSSTSLDLKTLTVRNSFTYFLSIIQFHFVLVFVCLHNLTVFLLVCLFVVYLFVCLFAAYLTVCVCFFVCLFVYLFAHLCEADEGWARKEVWSHAPISTSPPPNQISAEIPHC